METVNLDKLTEKIYREAIQKAKAEADEILKNATARSVQIIADAKQEAERNIIAKAKKEAELLKSSTESELQLNAKRLVSDLKREITGLISEKVLAKNIRGVFLDPEYFKEIIIEIVKQWGKDSELEFTLPENMRKKIDKKFTDEILRHIKDLTIRFDEKVEGGFRIARTGDTYQLSFTDRDFIAFFDNYLTEKTRRMLFSGQK